MKIERNLKVPTGNILVGRGEHGLLEFLSIGDYGKNTNIKADFLGVTRELNGVPNGNIMPLSEKWVITISTQYGCSMKCRFCDVPKVGQGKNATYRDLEQQIVAALLLHPEITYTKRLNIHYARMGEPTFNRNVMLNALNLKKIIAPYIGDSLIHPVVSTMLPKNNTKLEKFLREWCTVKNYIYNGDAGLQFSINSTDAVQREWIFQGKAHELNYIARLGDILPMPRGRKYTLNFAIADDTLIDAELLARMFDPDKFMCKITPLHRTSACRDNDIKTTGGYDEFTPYQTIEAALKQSGFDVIVFVPSYDEDDGLITCGNAILSGSLPACKYTELK
jgi:23S rRNA (adenine2503-C2)-methyltransferase